ncbi:hypothetical protein HD554DRAFT_2012576 [Boletus coccyginus]|nr:hypothetical protein HD554DRAFT_2012576 [Boletus coccyginus]
MEPLVNLPTDSPSVVDADEEIFLLYSALNQTKTSLVGPDGYRGLGYLDSRKDTLTVQFELRPPSLVPSPLQPTKKPKHPRKKASKEISARVVEIKIAQDPTALRSRRGDTGSVVWRASTELAKVVLQQRFLPPELPVFNPDRLAESHCLELGAGTGLLGITLAPLARTYTITDIKLLLPLIQKNVSLNSPGWRDGSLDNDSKSNITIEELDWLVFASLPSGTARARYCPVPMATSALELESADHVAWDVVFAVDCIYNPSLLPALVDTLDAVSTAGRTWVLVVAELRQEDVLREFLDLWLKQASGRWEITRVEGMLDVHFVMWAGRKRPD